MNYRRLFLFLILATSYCSVLSQKLIPGQPKLVIQVVIENMRYDFIDKFRDKFSDKGFNRLLNEGSFCSNAFYDYMYTGSAQGYTTLSTGTNPSDHGIVSDLWYNRLSGKEQYCITDPEVKTGTSLSMNKFSPKNIIGSTLGDELKLSNYKQSKVISVSLKNYAAVLTSGMLANAAYWFDDKTGYWTSGSFYMDTLPKWVNDFNKKEFVDLYLQREWNTTLKLSSYTESLADNNSYETGFSGNKRTFPYQLQHIKESEGLSVIKYTPFGNTITLDFSISAIINEQLGKGKFPDLITISFSIPAYVTELFGIHSIELEDIYLRLDNDIAHLLEFIDDYLGKENVLVVLTSDRGAADNPDYLKEIGMPVGTFNPELAMSLTDSYLKATYGQSGWIKKYYDNQVYLSQYLLDVTKVPAGEIQLKAAQFINQFKGIAKATTATILQSADSSSGMLKKFRNSFNELRSGDILLCFEPGWMEENKKESGHYLYHGSPYRYDAHVPLFFYGWNLKKDEITEAVPINNVAPTIARILGIAFPSGANGNPVKEIIDQQIDK
ncbi:MAG: alkaline phosphatase family protein [Bacteroidales bacterium]